MKSKNNTLSFVYRAHPIVLGSSRHYFNASQSSFQLAVRNAVKYDFESVSSELCRHWQAGLPVSSLQLDITLDILTGGH